MRTPRVRGGHACRAGMVGVVGLWTSLAAASDDYPSVLLKTYQITVDCLFCHSLPGGGPGTVDKPFAQGLMDNYGLVGNNLGSESGSLVDALAAAEADQFDADADGVPDADELREDGNPNDPNVKLGAAVELVMAEYGCVGTVAGNARSSHGGVLTAVLSALLLLVGRRGRLTSV